MSSKFFFKTLVAVPVAPVMTGIIMHFIFYIRCISTHNFLYFFPVFATFVRDISVHGTATSISIHVFFLWFSLYISGLFVVTSLIP
jgi:hypothetical protein